MADLQKHNTDLQKLKFATLELYENISAYTKDILKDDGVPVEKRDALADALAKVTEAAALLSQNNGSTGA